MNINVYVCTDWHRTERQSVLGGGHRVGRGPYHHDWKLRPAQHARQAEAKPTSPLIHSTLLHHLISILPSALLRRSLVLSAHSTLVCFVLSFKFYDLVFMNGSVAERSKALV
jgi:hypothetical protein